MLEINIVRHGETRWNAEGRIQGHQDSELTPAGQEQAEAAARALRARRIRVLYCSSLGRALRTATIIAQYLQVEMHARHELWECGWGKWEGLSWEDLHRKFPGEMQRRTEDRYEFRPPGGESYREAEMRVRPFVQEIQRSHPDGAIVIVGHVMINRVLVKLFLGWSFEEMLHLRQDERQIYRVLIGGPEQGLEVVAVR